MSHKFLPPETGVLAATPKSMPASDLLVNYAEDVLKKAHALREFTEGRLSPILLSQVADEAKFVPAPSPNLPPLFHQLWAALEGIERQITSIKETVEQTAL